MTLNYYLNLLILATFLSSCNGNAQNSEAIKDSRASELFDKALQESRNGVSGWQKALNLLDEANEIEPNNPLILHERAMLKITSKIDVSGGFIDHQAAIDYSTDSFNLRLRYENRALDYLACSDICLACDDWKKSGDFGKPYLKKYCNRRFDSTIFSNPDSALILSLELESPKAYITSTHNSPGMSMCTGTVKIQNMNHSTITLIDGFLDYGLEYRNKSSLYLEAVDSNGVKYHFFQQGFSDTYGSNETFKLEEGMEYTKEIDITQFHHFSRVGNYKVRICFRPSVRTKGLKKTYYSNWVAIEVKLK